MQEQDSLRRAAELSRMDRLEASEKLHQAKQDSLYILTSIKLDEAVRGRIQSEESTKKELLNLIKLQIKGEESGLNISDLSDEAQTDLFSKSSTLVCLNFTILAPDNLAPKKVDAWLNSSTKIRSFLL